MFILISVIAIITIIYKYILNTFDNKNIKLLFLSSLYKQNYVFEIKCSARVNKLKKKIILKFLNLLI